MSKIKITDYQQRLRVPELEHQVLEYWDETHAFEQSVEKRDPKKSYVFYDGPPFATGLPHYGHILASTIKDVIPRYWTMKGYRVERVWGWDCHGIPIENMIEKELGLKGGKKGIEEMGIGKFNGACRAAILRFDKDWEKVIRRIGRWVDFKNSYKTMDKTYMESVWWAFKSLSEKKLVYEGKKVILYCPRCATPLSNFEIAMDNSYKELPGPSTIYKYKVKNEKNTYMLAWSTTPWNKLATPALAVNPTLEYVKVKQGDEFFILAKSTLKILKETPAYEIVESNKGKELEKLEFELHFDFYPNRNSNERAGVVVADEYVTADEGTGVVTLAVYGEDDYRVMTKHHIQQVYHVDDEGKLKPEVTPWAGMFMLKVNPLVNQDLESRGLIYHNEERLHSVPVCYRCETRLYHAPVPAWFIDVQKMKPTLLKQNEHINWYPGHLKQGRFGKGVETAPDWNISRSRYWGTPMPVWKSHIPYSTSQKRNDTYRIIGSLDELKKWAVDPVKVGKLTDIHREYLDDLEVWVDDARTVKGKRIPEVFDCWVESGSMPYASIHYPFENKERFEKSHPAQFIAEYIAQTRAWFYTLHVMSVGLFGKHTFENAVTTGTILAEDGTKMSKSKKNFPDPSLLFEKYGVDALRFYLMSSVVMKGENLNFSEKSVAEIQQKTVSLLWNTFSFYKLYATTESVELPLLKDDLDKWIVSKTTGLIKEMTTAMDAYDTVHACRSVQAFIDELSTWYVRRSRQRIKENKDSQQVLGWVLKQLVTVMAPITPFITELVYHNLIGDKESVHLHRWPTFDEKRIDVQLEEQMAHARKLVELAHAARKEKGVMLKQPLLSLVTIAPQELSVGVQQIIKDEVNVKEIKHTVGQNYTATLDFTQTEELLLESKARELVRKIQQLRKNSGVKVTDYVNVEVPTNLIQYESFIKERALVKKIVWGDNLKLLDGQSS